ncbi:MAG TPA: hypothetical protein VHY37_03700 [Tepidisphaeraceae bacterium]|nr:hypothetical protein [Tepidisphaeraceae bacterium]
MVKCAVSIFLLLAFAAFASGGVHYFHEGEESAEETRLDAVGAEAATHGKPVPVQHHDESHCQICAALHMALLAGAWASIVVCLGLLLALAQVPMPLQTAKPAAAAIGCRGPPGYSRLFRPIQLFSPL